MDNSAFPDIASLLQNPAAMSFLSSLLGSQQKSEPPKEATASPDAVSKLMSVLSGFSSNQNGAKTPNDRTQNSKIGENSPFSVGVFGTKEEIKNRIALLAAVRPYLSEARRERLETVIKLLRLAELGTLSNMLSGN